MINIEIIVLMVVIFALYFLGGCIDKQYNLRIIDWLNGNCSTPFTTTKQNLEAAPEHTQKEQEITRLKTRIEVLEKIVTEPAFELNQKLNALK